MVKQVPQQKRRSHNHRDADLPRSHAWLALTCMRDPRQCCRTAPAAKAGSDLQCQLVIEPWRLCKQLLKRLSLKISLYAIFHNDQPQRGHVLISRCHPRDASRCASPSSFFSCRCSERHFDSDLASFPGAAPGTFQSRYSYPSANLMRQLNICICMCHAKKKKNAAKLRIQN